MEMKASTASEMCNITGLETMHKFTLFQEKNIRKQFICLERC
jgi:hypothetical protein